MGAAWRASSKNISKKSPMRYSRMASGCSALISRYWRSMGVREPRDRLGGAGADGMEREYIGALTPRPPLPVPRAHPPRGRAGEGVPEKTPSSILPRYAGEEAPMPPSVSGNSRKSPPLPGRACSGDRERGPGGEGLYSPTMAPPLLLTLDTGSPRVSVALGRGGHLLAERSVEIDRSSGRLLEMVAEVL